MGELASPRRLSSGPHPAELHRNTSPFPLLTGFSLAAPATLLMHMFQGRELIVVANREPYRHERAENGQLIAMRSASGVVNAVEPLLLSHSGVWIAEGVGECDRAGATEHAGLPVPPASPRYRLRRVWLSEIEQHAY